MSDPDHLSRLQDIMRGVFGIQDLIVDEDTTADDIDMWDSLSHIDLIVAVEKGFEVRFRNAEVARLRSVGDLRDLVAKKLAKKK